MKETITIKEYEYIMCGESTNSACKSLAPKHFDALEKFILENNNDAVELMNISIKKGLGKVITAKNYVGVLSLNDGTTIEILPKIYSADESTEKSKKLLIKMLQSLKTAPYKTMQKTNVDTEKLNIFEIFVRMFLDEVFSIVKHGLKCNYESIEENLNVFKGKMIFPKQIKHNLAHKERSYVVYDEFNTNRAENKLLKSTLMYLYKKTISSKNKNDIRTLLNSFIDVEESENYNKDFASCIRERNMKGYNTALMWSKVFLQGKSFTSFYGSSIAYALLFPMETLFESYVAARLKKVLDSSRFTVSVQDSKYHLFDEPKRFKMRPDIVVTRKEDNAKFVMDTKWKVLAGDKSNISQSDMYQMYAYHKKYCAKNVTLLYPMTDLISADETIDFKSREENDNVEVGVRFIDLYDIDNSLECVKSIIECDCFYAKAK